MKMKELSQRINVKGNLTTIEGIEDIELLKTMYKTLNGTHAETQKRAAALAATLKGVQEAVDVLLGLSSLPGAVRELQEVLNSHIDATDSMASALQAQEVQIHNLSQRLDKVENPAMFEALDSIKIKETKDV